MLLERPARDRQDDARPAAADDPAAAGCPEALEVTRSQSVAGCTTAAAWARRPFRAPHHTISAPAWSAAARRRARRGDARPPRRPVPRRAAGVPAPRSRPCASRWRRAALPWSAPSAASFPPVRARRGDQPVPRLPGAGRGARLCRCTEPCASGTAADLWPAPGQDRPAGRRPAPERGGARLPAGDHLGGCTRAGGGGPRAPGPPPRRNRRRQQRRPRQRPGPNLVRLTASAAQRSSTPTAAAQLSASRPPPRYPRRPHDRRPRGLRARRAPPRPRGPLAPPARHDRSTRRMSSIDEEQGFVPPRHRPAPAVRWRAMRCGSSPLVAIA